MRRAPGAFVVCILYRVKIVSLEQFQQQFINVEEYIARRNEYQFGSATDPETESCKLAADEYIECGMIDRDGKRWSARSLSLRPPPAASALPRALPAAPSARQRWAAPATPAAGV